MENPMTSVDKWIAGKNEFSAMTPAQQLCRLKEEDREIERLRSLPGECGSWKNSAEIPPITNAAFLQMYNRLHGIPASPPRPRLKATVCRKIHRAVVVN
jgi:hypothetical protein